MNTMTDTLSYMRAKRAPAKTRISISRVAIALVGIGILLSALGVVYMKDLNRRLFIQYQTLLQQRSQYQTQWGKLLLEQSTWSTQASVQNYATKHLNMVMPKSNNVVMVEQDSQTRYSAKLSSAPKVLAMNSLGNIK
ncbi:MAG: cell division protein FtsL [Gammaproteobacteria bacterium]|nr:cell division protein FtsL [Gammaproteobacteria bacterium]